LIRGLAGDGQALVQQQLALAKREVAEESKKARKAAALLAAGLGIVLFGSIFLGLMLVYLAYWASSERLPLWAWLWPRRRRARRPGSRSLVAGPAEGRRFHLVPEQTVAALKDNLAWLKKQT
jgi:hypothetical protein